MAVAGLGDNDLVEPVSLRLAEPETGIFNLLFRHPGVLQYSADINIRVIFLQIFNVVVYNAAAVKKWAIVSTQFFGLSAADSWFFISRSGHNTLGVRFFAEEGISHAGIGTGTTDFFFV